MENKKHKVYCIQDEHVSPSSLVYFERQGILDHIDAIIDNLEEGKEEVVKISIKEMTDKEIGNLPEFDG